MKAKVGMCFPDDLEGVCFVAIKGCVSQFRFSSTGLSATIVKNGGGELFRLSNS